MTEPTKEDVEKAKNWAQSFEDLHPSYKTLGIRNAITLRDALTASEAREAALREALDIAVSRGCSHCADSIRQARALVSP